ncbi:hypothetical protein, partial [Cytobacillus firmus]|uniref:Glycosyltransferase n=1 Tax=Cytobacillus firmus DS1 TaxID=1307436 RepID=W7KSB3_CYTFI
MIHILIAGHDLKFAKHIIDFLKDNKKYKLRIDKWLSHTDHDINKSKELLNWAEIIFCEWGLGNAVWYSNNKTRDQKLIIRMLGQERLSSLPQKIKYNNVNHIIFISPHLRQSLIKIFNIPISKTSIIYNLVDSTHFSKPKRKGSIYNLGIVGVSPKLKRLDLAIEIFNKLWMKNSKYHLYM